ncbi:YibE/F family protein [Nocardioides terrigena]|uniref:YibE/F family protein n=1 Tax=Nocardioides terrigena TaxID=424797 RepID=UPI000D30E731|nr:YibE/F family protein [Nocardioides terrigena]
MGAHHSHRALRVHTSGPVTRILLVGLVLAGLSTIVGLVVLWPSGDRPASPYAADGVTYPRAEVVEIGEACPVITSETGGEFPEGCDRISVRLVDDPGVESTVAVPPGTAGGVLEVGDRVVLASLPQQEGAAQYAFVGVDRTMPIAVMTAVFVIIVGLIARLRGLLALLGLVLAGGVVGYFMLPALMTGAPGLLVALVGSSAIMFMVLYLAHGVSVRTSTALAGTLFGLLVTAALGVVAIDAARLTGLGDESALNLRLNATGLDFRGLLTCAVIVAGLGVLNDVTITQSSAVWELRSAAPEMSRARIFASGMRIGRDHIASTIYTIVFAYAGTALASLLLIALYDRPLLDVLSDELISEEIIRTLASAIGLVLAVPVTTAIAAATVAPAVHQRAGAAAPEGSPVA